MSFDIEFVYSDGLQDKPEVTANSSLSYSSTITEGPFYQYPLSTYAVINNEVGDWSWYWNGQFLSSSSSSSITLFPYTYYRDAYFGVVGSEDHYYIRRTYVSSGSVAITPSTLQQGAPHVGGVAVSESIATTQDGVTGALSPASEFGLIIKNGTSEIFRVSYLPPALAAESSHLDAFGAKIITATHADLNVEAYGLGDGQKLLSGDTNVVVKE